MIWRVSLLAVLVLWIAIPDAAAVGSVPASDGGVLTAGVGQQISLTCSHNNDVTVTTLWKISAPIDCSRSLTHQSGSIANCGPFSFVNVTQGNAAPFTSTAVATANASMTGAVVQCFDGAGTSAVQVGSNITLCVYGPVSGVSCSNNLDISWNAVIDSPACVNQVEYMVTITNISGVVTTRNVSVNQVDVSDVFQRGESYNVSVCSKAVGGSCSAEPVTILCEISLTPPPPTTSTTPATTTSPVTPSNTTSQQGTPVVAIVLPVLVVVAIIVIIIVIIIAYIFYRKGHNKQHRTVSPHAVEGKHKPKSASVSTMGNKPNKGGADYTEMPTYQDPSTIQHQQAAGGVLYALTDKSKKEEKSKESQTEDPATIQHEQAPSGVLYALSDKLEKREESKESKKEGLNYAEIKTGRGSGTPVNFVPRTNYSTINH